MVANAVRTERTRAALVRAARSLFARDGYAATSTPAIIEVAGVSRGALYHHFGGKAELFRAVVEAEQETVIARVNEVPFDDDDPLGSMIRAGDRFLEVMSDPGSQRLLYVDGPSVLGDATMLEIDFAHGVNSIEMGLRRAMEIGALCTVPVEAMANVLSAAYDRAAVHGDDEHRDAVRLLLEGLRADPASERAGTAGMSAAVERS